MLVVGLSGPSSSGKSTLARLLAGVLPRAVIVYEDDFYRPEGDIPVTPAGVQNWDAPGAFDLAGLQAALGHARATGALPAGFESKEEKNDIGDASVGAENYEAARALLATVAEPVVLVDGILLYHRGSPVLGDLDVRLLIPGDRETLRARRAARSGYATIEGFWTDPPGYFDEIVWPEYQKWYGHLLEDGCPTAAAEKDDIRVPPALDLDSVFMWAATAISDAAKASEAAAGGTAAAETRA